MRVCQPYDTEPAFPISGVSRGIEFRDYFAAKAMQGLIVGVDEPRHKYIAEVAYAMADAMLAERRK